MALSKSIVAVLVAHVCGIKLSERGLLANPSFNNNFFVNKIKADKHMKHECKQQAEHEACKADDTYYLWRVGDRIQYTEEKFGQRHVRTGTVVQHQCSKCNGSFHDHVDGVHVCTAEKREDNREIVFVKLDNSGTVERVYEYQVGPYFDIQKNGSNDGCKYVDASDQNNFETELEKRKKIYADKELEEYMLIRKSLSNDTVLTQQTSDYMKEVERSYCLDESDKKKIVILLPSGTDEVVDPEFKLWVSHSETVKGGNQHFSTQDNLAALKKLAHKHAIFYDEGANRYTKYDPARVYVE